MITAQISVDDLDKLHKDLQQKRERICFLEVISSADSKQADSYISKQENLIQSLQNELETAKTIQADYLKFNQNISNENKELKSELEAAKFLRDKSIKYSDFLCEERSNLKQRLIEKTEILDNYKAEIFELERRIDQLNAVIKCRNLTTGKSTLIGTFKLTSLNSNQSIDSIVLSGTYVVEKLNKIQGMAANSVVIDELVLDENRDYDLTSDDDIGW